MVIVSKIVVHATLVTFDPFSLRLVSGEIRLERLAGSITACRGDAIHSLVGDYFSQCRGCIPPTNAALIPTQQTVASHYDNSVEFPE